MRSQFTKHTPLFAASLRLLLLTEMKRGAGSARFHFLRGRAAMRSQFTKHTPLFAASLRLLLLTEMKRGAGSARAISPFKVP